MTTSFFRSLGARLSFLRGGSQVSIPRDPSFDISRIEHHPDKQLLAQISKYYITLTTGDFNGMTALQAEDLQISDICKNLRIF